jgi:hypothetical protein
MVKGKTTTIVEAKSTLVLVGSKLLRIIFSSKKIRRLHKELILKDLVHIEAAKKGLENHLMILNNWVLVLNRYFHGITIKTIKDMKI